MLVLQWARETIKFPELVESLTRSFADRYNPAKWQEVFNLVFRFADPGEDIEDGNCIPMAVAAVEAAMASRGVTIASTAPSAAQSSTADSKGKGKRKAINGPQRSLPRKRMHSISVIKFLDVEAQANAETGPSRMTKTQVCCTHSIIAECSTFHRGVHR